MKKLDALALKTKNVLITLSKLEELNQFTFVGGSALSVYLKHRISEDLDFFSWGNELRNEALLREIKNTFPKGFKIETLNKKQLNLKIEDVKITFFANNWQELKKNEKLTGSINIAPIKLLTGMKINSLFLRAKFRDYYDLYVINKEKYTVEQMYEIIKEYMPEINKKLFQTALVFTDDITEDNINHLKPKYDVNPDKIRKSFEDQIYEWIKR
jgi:predicted nucleotidyltransferase component of viral defense system